MTPKPSPRLPACPPPADPGSAAVVAHAAESSSGACIPPTLEQFERWLESKAHTSAVAISKTHPRYSFARDLYLDHSLVIAECRVAIKLLMQFEFEEG